MRIRKLTLNSKKTLVPISTKAERREKNRERKALIAARLDLAIEKQLAQRMQGKDVIFSVFTRLLLNNIDIVLQTNAIVNFPERAFEKAIDEEEVESDYDQEEEVDQEEEYEDDEDVGRVQYVAADEVEISSSEDEDEDMEDIPERMAVDEKPSTSKSKTSKSRKQQRRRPRGEILYDDEETEQLRGRAEAQAMRQTVRR